MNRHQRRAEKKLGRPVQDASAGTQKAFANALQHHQAGRLSEAERLYRQILTVEPRHADSLHLLGMVAYQAGRPDVAADLIGQAIGIHGKVAFYHCNLGLVLSAQGKLDEAVACYRQALALDRNYVEAHNNLGNALKDQGKFDEAAGCYRRAIALKPDLAEAHSNLGNALRAQGKPDQAIDCYRRALILKPGYADAHCNLGNALQERRQLDEAVACYRHALVLKPDLAEAHNSLGNALKELGTLDEAAACYRRALELRPQYADALNNLALLLMMQGEADAALNTIKQSLKIGETAHAKRVFVECANNLHPTIDDRELRAALVRALTEPWCRPSKLARTSTQLIKLAPDVGACVARAASAWPRRLSTPELFASNGLAALAADDLLCALLGSTPIADIELERFLTTARCNLLEAAAGSTKSADDAGPALRFYGALARQCFINEYVFCSTDDEIQKADDLCKALAAALETQVKVPVLWVAAAAAYVPLSSLPLAGRLLDMDWPEDIAAILTQQIREPAEELQLRTTIARLTDIDDKVSRLVRDQYEENPYPRWIKAEPVANSQDIVAYLSRKFPLACFKPRRDSANIDILIAGCGTGQHAIGMARIFAPARLLAVDLSLSSLGYAKRKTHELGLSSIDYGQADLLKLGSLNRNFDVIGCVGVLHHLNDPWQGWRAMLPLLRPGGFMNLGLYSEVARRGIVKARAIIAERNFGTTAEEIRRCRQDLLGAGGGANFGMAVTSTDFFSTSACRDLLFHAQEHRMTLTGIDAFLRDNDLTFLGFEIDSDVLQAYRRRFPGDAAATDLAQWQIFEHENPDTFAGMYQFWVQKPG